MMRYVEIPEEGGGLIDLSLCLLEDIRAAQMPAVEVNNGHFSLVSADFRVPTAEVMPDRLAAAPPGISLEPYGPGTPDTEVVQPWIL